MSQVSLRRFWIEFEPEPGSPGFPRFGVTAVDLADALALIERWRDGMTPSPMGTLGRPSTVVEDIDVSTLDRRVPMSTRPIGSWRRECPLGPGGSTRFTPGIRFATRASDIPARLSELSGSCSTLVAFSRSGE